MPDATLVDRAMLLASELVTNAVIHARTDLRLRLELRGDLLHLAVRDGSPRLLHLVTSPDPKAPRWARAWLVEQLARAWGVNPHPRGRQGRLVHPHALTTTARQIQLDPRVGRGSRAA